MRLEQLPELVPAGDLLGSVPAEIALSLGLPGPLPLVSGVRDGQASGLALGATTPGIAYLNLGTSMVLGVQSKDYLWDPAFRTLAGIRPGTYTLETVLKRGCVRCHLVPGAVRSDRCRGDRGAGRRGWGRASADRS